MGKYRLANGPGLVTLQYQAQQVAFLHALARRHCLGGHSWSIRFGDPATLVCPVCGLAGKRDFDRMLLLAGRQGGKALALDTPIATIGGWKTMGDLQVGDVVFDERGQPTRVSYVSPIFVGRACYRLEFSDGSRLVADADHEWLTLDKLARKRWNQPARVRTTREIAATVLHGGESNHAISLCEPLDYPETSLPVPPYTLGAWLGDGSSKAAEITCCWDDAQIVDEIARDGFEIRPRKSAPDKAPMFAIGVPGFWRSHVRSLGARLRALGVLNCKHVPEQYLRASIEDRLALLQGLMDTDGHCAPDGEAEFCSTNADLAAAVYELAVGLGIRPRLVADQAQLYGRVIGPRYRVSWTHTTPVFRLARKAARLPKTLKMSQHFRYVRAVVPVPTVPVRCIQVESPSSLFLAGGACIPTHNTRVGTLGGVLEASMPGSYGWVTAPTYRDLTDFVEPAFFAQLPQQWLEDGEWNVSDRLLVLPNNARVAFRSLEDPQSVRGPTLDWWLMDEACKVNGLAHEIGDAMLAIKEGVEILTTTPRGEDWVWEQVWCRAEAGVPGYWAARWISTDNPTMSKTYIDGKRATMSAEMFKQEYEADFVTFQGAIYGSTLIDPCVIDDKTEAGYKELKRILPEWPEINPARTALVGLDPGSDHPFAGVLGLITDSHFLIVGEYEEREKPAMIHAANLRALVGNLSPRWGVDRSQPQMILELAQHGIFAQAVEAGPGSVVAGIERVKSWLLSGRMKFVKSRTKRLVSALKSYRWAETEKKDGSSGIQTPYKRKDDLPDALSYLVRMWPHLPEVPAEETGVRDLSKLDAKSRAEIERVIRCEGLAKEKAVEDTGEFYGSDEEYGVAEEFYA